MLKDITLGQYFPVKSLVHRLDPRMKLILTVLWMCMVFIPKNWFGVLLTVLFLVLMVALMQFLTP